MGPHKTGSSYIQKVFSDNRSLLREHGLEYPDQFCHIGGHHQLFEHFKAGGESPEYLKFCDEIKSLNEDIFLSSERFSKIKPGILKEALSPFQSYRVKIIYHYRTPSVRFYSNWKESIKQGRCESFGEAISRDFIRPFLSRQLNSMYSINSYSDTFGKENLIILDAESGMKNGTTATDLLSAIECNAGLVELEEDVNASFPVEVIELLRQLNAMHICDGHRPSSVVRERFFERSVDSHATTKELIELISSVHHLDITLGNTPVDKFVYEKLLEDYPGQLANSLTAPQVIRVKVPRNNWIWRSSSLGYAAKALESIYKMVES